jgi:hypothetical protein
MIKYPNYRNLFKTFFQFDKIRLQKILHISQNAIFTGIFSFLVGTKIDSYFEEEGQSNESKLETILYLLIHLTSLILTVYYVRKASKFIPFMFRLTNSYDPFHKSHDGENLIGSSLAMSIVLVTTQTNLKHRLSKLQTMFS